MIYVLLVLAALALLWFFGPTVWSLIKRKRHELHIQALTRRTIRDMNAISKKRV